MSTSQPMHLDPCEWDHFPVTTLSDVSLWVFSHTLDTKSHIKMLSSDGIKSKCSPGCPKGEGRPWAVCRVWADGGDGVLCAPAEGQLWVGAAKGNGFLLPCAPHNSPESRECS